MNDLIASIHIDSRLSPLGLALTDLLPALRACIDKGERKPKDPKPHAFFRERMRKAA